MNGINNALSEILKNYNISKTEFEKKIGIDHPVMDLWMSGLTKPHVNQLIRISKLYHVSTDFLLFYEKRDPLVIQHLCKKDKDIIYALVSRFKNKSYITKEVKNHKVPLDIHDKIKYLRTEVIKLSQREFGKQIDVSRDTIKHWESGVSMPNTEQIIIISLLCNVSTDYVIIDSCSEQIGLYYLNQSQYDLIKKVISEFESKGTASEK